MTNTNYFSPAEAAKALQLHRNTLSLRLKAGHIKYVQFGARRRIPRDEVERVLREGLPRLDYSLKATAQPIQVVDPCDSKPRDGVAAVLIFRGIDLVNCTEREWTGATGMSFYPPILRARLSYIAGTDPDKPRLPRPATDEELNSLAEDLGAFGLVAAESWSR